MGRLKGIYLEQLCKIIKTQICESCRKTIHIEKIVESNTGS